MEKAAQIRGLSNFIKTTGMDAVVFFSMRVKISAGRK
jgi:hypothetical protein